MSLWLRRHLSGDEFAFCIAVGLLRRELVCRDVEKKGNVWPNDNEFAFMSLF